MRMLSRRSAWRTSLPGYAGQACLLAVVIWLVVAGAVNFVDNLDRLRLEQGFRFLWTQAGFDISQALVDFSPDSRHIDAVWVALLNTLLVVSLAMVLSTLGGLAVAWGRLAAQPLIRGLSTAYVETFRNIPLLLQIYFWYFSALAVLPPVADSLEFAGALMNNRGLFLPWPRWSEGHLVMELPLARGLNVSGGLALLPELIALTLGLSIYNSAFLAEIFRAGIQSVPRGQSEAAKAVGLSPLRAAVLVVLPQAMRLSIPPAAGQYQSLAKASSLAAAIGYPDVMQVVGGTILSQTSQALEAMALVLAIYACINLLIALAGNLANRRIKARQGIA
jgi:general L-amino acid transport system permease protein